MVTKEDIERFLDRLAADQDASYTEPEPGLYLVKPRGELDFSVVVHFSPPVVILREQSAIAIVHLQRWIG